LPSKKIVSVFILTAALVASIIIAFGRDKSGTVINLASNLGVGEKVSIPENPNWQDELSGVSAGTEIIQTEDETASKTTTDTVSESLVSNYLALKQSGTLTSESAQKLIDQTVNYTSQTATSIKTPQLNVIADNGKQTIISYGENLGNILKNNKSAQGKNEITILEEALNKKDPQKMEELQEAIDNYQKVADQMAKMPVPEIFVKAHTDIVIGMETIILGLKEIKNVLNDPIMGIQGLKDYQQGGSLFGEAIGATLNFIKQNNIIYKQGSGGYYLLYGI